MSYSPKTAIDEREVEVAQAMQTRDVEALHTLAELFKEEGEDERADILMYTARKINREDWSYDEANDN